MTLTVKQERFCEEYLVDLNAKQAAIRCGYSPKTAEVQGSRLLSNAKVAERVTELQLDRAERVGVTGDQVLAELAILAASDVRDFKVEEDGTLVLREGARDEAWRAVSSVKHKTTTRGSGEDEFTVREIEFRLWDKPATLRLLMQHLGMLIEKHEHSGRGGIPLPATQVHVHLGDNGRGLTPPARLSGNGNGAR